MKTINHRKDALRLAASLALTVTAFACLTSVLCADDAKSTVPPKNQAAAPVAKPAPKQLTGAELYSMHCARCHPERYPAERTAGQWKTIVMHMRVRANLPADHARSILKYMQENSSQ